MGSGMDREELRQLVRDVLRSSLQGERSVPAQAAPANLIEAIRQAILPGAGGVVAVAGDLDQFAREIANAAAHEDIKAAIMTGRVRFRLKDEAGPPRPADAPAVRSGQFRIDTGM